MPADRERFYSLFEAVCRLCCPCVAREILKAIFELARQGFLDLPVRKRPIGARERRFVPEPIRSLMRNFESKFLIEIEATWEAYRKDLESVSCLDVLPSDWKEIRPLA